MTTPTPSAPQPCDLKFTLIIPERAKRRWLHEHYRQHVDFIKTDKHKIMFLNHKACAHFMLVHGYE